MSFLNMTIWNCYECCHSKFITFKYNFFGSWYLLGSKAFLKSLPESQYVHFKHDDFFYFINLGLLELSYDFQIRYDDS